MLVAYKYENENNYCLSGLLKYHLLSLITLDNSDLEIYFDSILSVVRTLGKI